MAISAISVAFTASDSQTFTFPTPAGNYAKTYPSVTITGGGEPVVADFLADSPSGGTITGTVQLSAPITGTAAFLIYDTL